jgi:hypothetical protein
MTMPTVSWLTLSEVRSPLIEVINSTAVDAALRRSIQQHWDGYSEFQIAIEQVSLSALMTPIPTVERERLESAGRLVDLFIESEIAPFESALVDGRVVVAPIFEWHASGPHLIDGLHRALALARHGYREILAIAIRATPMPPPVGSPIRIDGVLISDSPIAEAPFFEGKGLKDFRPSHLIVNTASRHLTREARES